MGSTKWVFVLILVLGIILLSTAVLFWWPLASVPVVPAPGDDTTQYPTSINRPPVDVGTSASTTDNPTVPDATKNNTLQDNAVADEVYRRLLSKWQTIDFEGKIVASTTDKWTVEYQQEFKIFLLYVLDYPGLDYQKTAEQTLLDALEMSKEDVCALGIQVRWKNWETQDAWVDKQLTFCN